jgi:hypothetical protein
LDPKKILSGRINPHLGNVHGTVYYLIRVVLPIYLKLRNDSSIGRPLPEKETYPKQFISMFVNSWDCSGLD